MTEPRIAAGGLRELGVVNWLLARAIARGAGVERAQLFTTLGRHRRVFRGWLHFSSTLLFPSGSRSLTRHETELVILRVAHLRGCAYELDHHRRLGERAGIDAALFERIEAGPQAPSWSPRQRALLAAVDELLRTKDLSDPSWSALATFYEERQRLEIVLLVGQYDMLATTLGTLRIARDVPLRASSARPPRSSPPSR